MNYYSIFETREFQLFVGVEDGGGGAASTSSSRYWVGGSFSNVCEEYSNVKNGTWVVDGEGEERVRVCAL